MVFKVGTFQRVFLPPPPLVGTMSLHMEFFFFEGIPKVKLCSKEFAWYIYLSIYPCYVNASYTTEIYLQAFTILLIVKLQVLDKVQVKVPV